MNKQGQLIRIFTKIQAHGKLIAFILFIGFVTYKYFSGKKSAAEYKNKILEHPVIVNGFIIDVEYKYKHGTNAEYTFIYDGKTYYNRAPVEYGGLEAIIKGRYFPVIVCEDDPLFYNAPVY